MTIEILDFIPVSLDTIQKGTWVKIGHVKLKISSDIQIVMEVIKGKDGGFWFRIPNVKVGNEYKPAYDFTQDQEFGKNVTKQIKDEFKIRYM